MTSKPVAHFEQPTEGQIPVIISSIATDKDSKIPPNRFGALEEYILLAEGDHIARPAKRYNDGSMFTRVFSRAPGRTPVMLLKNQINRIIIYSGCFNPPHRGHRELLCHAYFNADSKTIAAMIVPLGNSENGKAFIGSGDNAFQLTREQITQLWKDEFLERWSWIYPGRRDQIRGFKDRLRAIAAEDGYVIEFLALCGCDHVTVDGGSGIHRLGEENAITSDITRPADFLLGSDSQPFQIENYGKWRKILPGRGISAQSKVDCWFHRKFCWPCKKFKYHYPEYARSEQLNGTQALFHFCISNSC